MARIIIDKDEVSKIHRLAEAVEGGEYVDSEGNLFVGTVNGRLKSKGHINDEVKKTNLGGNKVTKVESYTAEELDAEVDKIKDKADKCQAIAWSIAL